MSLSTRYCYSQQVEGGPRIRDKPVCESRWQAAALSWTDHQDVGPGDQGGVQGESWSL